MQQWRRIITVLLQGLLVCTLLKQRGIVASAAAGGSNQQGKQQQQAGQTTAGTNEAAAAAQPAGPPSLCTPAAELGADFSNHKHPTNMVWGGNMLKVYHNLYYHNKKWYAVLDTTSNASSIDSGISLNAQLIKLPTTDTEDFQSNIKVCYVPGVTLFLDFPFPAFPDNLGHWAELLLPLYSALSSSTFPQLLQGSHRHIDRLLLLNVRQQLLYNWPREVLGLALNPALPTWPTPQNPATDKKVSTISSSSDSNSQGSSEQYGSRWRSRVGWHQVLPWERPLPPIIGPDDFDAWCASGWLVFENMAVMQDRYPIVSIPDEARPPRPQRNQAAADAHADAAADGNAQGSQLDDSSSSGGLWASDWVVGFNTPQLAARFRTEALARHLWDDTPPPPPPSQLSRHASQQQQQKQQCQADSAAACEAESASNVQQGRHAARSGADQGSSSSTSSGWASGPPRTVTVLWYPEDYPPVTNHRQLVEMLEELTAPYGFKVRTVSVTMGAPFLSHMATMADTGLLVGRHGPLLASAVLLPRGAAVLELLPYKWEWRGVSSLYYNMTQSTGRIHHWAWRPLDSKWCKYKEASDARYAGWLPGECQGRDCLLVHAQAGLEVDLEEVRQLLVRKLPGLVAGTSVEELSEPWPPAD